MPDSYSLTLDVYIPALNLLTCSFHKTLRHAPEVDTLDRVQASSRKTERAVAVGGLGEVIHLYILMFRIVEGAWGRRSGMNVRRDTECEQPTRQMPYVRCVRSVRHLLDPIDGMTSCIDLFGWEISDRASDPD